MPTDVREILTAIVSIQLVVFSGMFGLVIKLMFQQSRIEKENAVSNAISVQTARDTHQLLQMLIDNTTRKFDEQGEEIEKLDHRVTSLELDHAKNHK